MSDTLPSIREFLAASDLSSEIMACDPELADTAVFCEHYGIAPEKSANAIVVRSKTGEAKYAMCVVLATHRLDVNHTVRKKLGARKVSFASADETKEITGMEIGGVTPIGLPDKLDIWVDADVMQCEYIILGGGNRSSKLKVDPAILQQLPHCQVVDGLANKIS